jgi:hypothetical protein
MKIIPTNARPQTTIFAPTALGHEYVGEIDGVRLKARGVPEQNVSGKGHVLSILGSGLASRPYYLNTASNLVPPMVWQQIQTNISDVSGNILFTNMAPTNAQQFFLISGP